MKKRHAIGYIFCERRLGADEKAFLDVAKRKNIDLVMFNINRKINEKELENKAEKCDIIYNNSAEEFAQEFVKTLEQLGKKVVDSSRKYYYNEDKWIFFLECKMNKLPVPETILLSENIELAKSELKDFNHWPVILKRTQGTCGEFVDKANTLTRAEEIIKKFWKKGGQKSPIIAQEFIKSNSYRVTTIRDSIAQTAIKKNNGWKCTGVYGKKFKKFRIGKRLNKIIAKILKIVKIKVCGIDFLKKGNKWLILEVNTSPALDFFPEEREELVEKILDSLIKDIKEKQ